MSSTTKIRILFLAAFLAAVALLLLLTHGNRTQTQEDTIPETKIIVASDLHYLTSELTDHGSYFNQVINSADGKVTDYSEELLDAFVSQMLEEQPDVVILSGDLTFNGALLSHQKLTEKLTLLTDAGIQIAAIPGNHDLNNPMAASFHGDSFTLVSSITSDEFVRLYQPFGYGQALSQDSSSCSYVLEISPQLRLLLVDVNGNEKPGTLSDATLSWAEKQLEQASRDGASVIAVSHQNVLAHNSIFIDGFQMGNAKPLQELYRRYHVLCNLSGHMHIQHIAQQDGLTEILTSALSITPLQYGVITVSSRSLNYETRSVVVSGVAEQPDFAAYARQYFWDNSYRQASEVTDREDLAKFMADINTAYFSGTMDELAWDEKSAADLETVSGFWGIYLQSIKETGFASQRSLHLDF